MGHLAVLSVVSDARGLVGIQLYVARTILTDRVEISMREPCNMLNYASHCVLNKTRTITLACSTPSLPMLFSTDGTCTR